MADLFTSEQGKRLFGFIGAGGAAGSLLGPIITTGLSAPLGPINLLIAAIVLLKLAVFCVHRLERIVGRRQVSRPEEPRVGGSAFAAFPELIRSPYLLGVGIWVSVLSFGATIVYLEQANIVSASVHGAGAQTPISRQYRLGSWAAHSADAGRYWTGVDFIKMRFEKSFFLNVCSDFSDDLSN